MYACERMGVEKAIIFSYYYENTFDLTDTPRSQFEKKDLEFNEKQN